jgi:hypothetical protein
MSWDRDNLIENKLKKTTKLFFKNKTNAKNEIKKKDVNPDQLFKFMT